MKHIIKQFGLPRSGTNFVRFLLENNYKDVLVHVDTEGWKHGYVPDCLPVDRKCVVMHKHPLSWLVSAFRFLGRRVVFSEGDTFETFLRSKFWVMNKSQEHRNCIVYQDPVECWNEMNRHWAKFCLLSSARAMVGYDKLVKDPEQALAPLVAAWGLERKDGELVIPKEVLLPSTDGESRMGARSFNSSYYASEAYREMYTPAREASVMSRVDKSVLKELGYSS